MSKLSNQRDHPEPENKDEVGNDADSDPSSPSQTYNEDTVRFSNVKCSRPLLSSELRSPRLLPPISTDSETSRRIATSPLSPKLPSSIYHKHCTARNSAFMDWSVSTSRTNKITFGLRECQIVDYLNHNREFLESYVVKNVPLEQLERWKLKKNADNCVNESMPASRTFVKYKDKEMFMELVEKLQEDTNEHSVLRELARHISSSVGVDAYRVYKLYPDHSSFVQYFDTKKDSMDPKNLERADIAHVRHIIEVAKRGVTRRLSRYEEPANFPDTPVSLFESFGIHNIKKANHLLYQPVLSATGKTVYVIEMWRINKGFTKREEETSANFLVWGSLLLHYCNLYIDKKRERNMSDFLLNVVKEIFEEMVSLDLLIKRILEYAQQLVNADRASMFLVDYRNRELVSTVFDLKFDPDQGRDMEKKQIRMPLYRGIAGYVAVTGETMNIPDAYSDSRFNREVDDVTGYKTKSILCMPIKVQREVIGVVQMVNKRNNKSNNFEHEDEVAFEMFSTFFGLALHHARLYDKIKRREQKYKVALEVLSYHNTCKKDDVKAILTDEQQININFNDFYLDPYQLDGNEKCKAAINMFDDLFDISKFDKSTLTRFILTVKKNYRTVPYHNFDHGWSVAHAMYVILKNDTQKRFSYKMRLSLFVASLCHDLDHRGYTNKYMSETASPLAAMYTTSTLEHHHFNITVKILQQDGHNIFSRFSTDEYKDILRCIRQCILATDLAVFFPNLEKLKQIYSGKSNQTKFNWAVQGHRDLAMAISMTAADLCASAKPWEIQIKTVKVIFEEFYDQGDKERAAGKTPIPMMDRSKPDEQPSSQVGFLSQICLPCYSMLYKILPKTEPMYVMAKKNLDNWKSQARNILSKLENESSNYSSGNISDSELNDGQVTDQVLLDNLDESCNEPIVENGEGLDEELNE